VSGTLAPQGHDAGVAVLDGDRELAADVLSHLAAQIGSAERLLEIVLEQGGAIRNRQVYEVVRLAGLMHAELSRRATLDEQRAELLRRSAARLGVRPEAVTITALGALMDSDSAAHAAARSAELRGLLDELQREHIVNRALMRIQLSFLDHLFQTLSLEGSGAYDASGSAGASAARESTAGNLHVLDMEA